MQAPVFSIISRTNTPPGSPAVNDAYFITASPTGAWTGKANYIAVWVFGGWQFSNPPKGSLIWSIADSRLYLWDGSALADSGGVVGAVSGTQLAPMPIPVHLAHMTNAAVAAGAAAWGNAGSSSLTARWEVPAGKTLFVLYGNMNPDTGAGTGTWSIDLIVRKNNATNVVITNFTTAVANSSFNKSATGTYAAPLATFAAGDLLQIGFANGAGSPGPMGTNNKAVNVQGVLL